MTATAVKVEESRGIHCQDRSRLSRVSVAQRQQDFADIPNHRWRACHSSHPDKNTDFASYVDRRTVLGPHRPRSPVRESFDRHHPIGGVLGGDCAGRASVPKVGSLFAKSDLHLVAERVDGLYFAARDACPCPDMIEKFSRRIWKVGDH
jgi:hypothetical protein